MVESDFLSFEDFLVNKLRSKVSLIKFERKHKLHNLFHKNSIKRPSWLYDSHGKRKR